MYLDAGFSSGPPISAMTGRMTPTMNMYQAIASRTPTIAART